MVMSLEPGQVLDGKYRIVRLIGEGGMGSVHEGENTFISRRVAIKVLHAAAAGNEAVLKRFEREAQAAGRIGSDHILEVLDLGTLPDGDRYMVMEYLDGEELSKRIERMGIIPPRQLASLIRQTLVGLRAAHAAEIVHRDLKPDNIFILREKAGHADFVKIIDFGISKFNALTGDMSMTTTGAVMGTPFYMSPEQAKGAAGVDARTDLYAIGVIMYEALTGRVPFEGTSFNDLMFKIVLSDAPPLPDSVPEDFREIVQRAMSRDATNRFQSADEFIQALDRWLVANGFGNRESSANFDMGHMTSAMAAGGDLSRTAYAPSGAGTTKTAGAWAQTNGEVRPASGLNVKLLAGIGGGVLLAAVAAFALMGGGGEAPAEAAAPAAPPPALSEKMPTPQPEAVPAPPPAPVAAPAPPPPPPPTATVSPPAVVKPVADKPATTTTTKKPVATTTKKPATTTTKKPTTTTTKKPGGSRDFGY
jgi:hypothetical protein